MTTTCVAILDEDNWDARTDIIALVDSRRRRIIWVPRDLWAESFGDRINMAYRRGELLPRLRELGFPCDGLLCLRRGATEAALRGVEVDVPVSAMLDFWYPMVPGQTIESGRKQVSFRPPVAHLQGERLHQWIGARYAVDGSGSDLNRLRRQIVLLRALIAQHASFATALADPAQWRREGADPLPVLAGVDNHWRMTVFDRVRPTTIDGKQVLVRIGWPRQMLHRARGALARFRQGGSSWLTSSGLAIHNPPSSRNAGR
jgi:hypothetical protein